MMGFKAGKKITSRGGFPVLANNDGI